MIISAIDIGTNTTLQLIAEVNEGGNISVLDHQQRFPRLGNDLKSTGFISDISINKLISIIDEFTKISNKFNVNSTVIFATRAMRECSNKNEIIHRIEKIYGKRINVITAEKEAELTFLGTVNCFKNTPNDIVVLDIGGGSTEIIELRKEAIAYNSLPLGAVSLFENYFRTQTQSDDNQKPAAKYLHHIFNTIPNPPSNNKMLVGVAGTVTTLACLDQNLKMFEIDKIKGYNLKLDNIIKWSKILFHLSPEEILNLSDAAIGREDILPTGVFILKEFMEYFKFYEITVSERGLRYGMVLEEWNKNKSYR
ncbi:MAG: hypothetical protein HY964_09390 [Ignavibacteriales bacterium]|nr:hypothetical protein [Ignavibacteriales bacterium]